MGINDIISVYLAAKAAQAAAEKAAREAKARAEAAALDIIRHAAGRPGFETDAYAVSIGKASRTTLDTAALYRDFPDIKDTYGRTSTRDTITALARQQADTMTA